MVRDIVDKETRESQRQKDADDEKHLAAVPVVSFDVVQGWEICWQGSGFRSIMQSEFTTEMHWELMEGEMPLLFCVACVVSIPFFSSVGGDQFIDFFICPFVIVSIN